MNPHTTCTILALCILLGACSQEAKSDSESQKIAHTDGFPLSKIEPAKAVSFSVDLGRPFHVVLGRGSGLAGLDTVAFGIDGDVTMFKQQPAGKWQTASVRLSPEAIARIFDQVKAQDVMNMSAEYHADVHDGTQWVLWIKQHQKSKAIYYKNNFPNAKKRLAECLDEELALAGMLKDVWNDVPESQYGEHDRALWDSIK